MADDYTEVTSQGWGSRIMESIKGVLVGGAFFVGSFPLLIWNEGRAIKTARSLEEGAGAVVSVPADRVDAGNQGKLLHVSGQATTSETLADSDFGVSANAIHLKRVVECLDDELLRLGQRLGPIAAELHAVENPSPVGGQVVPLDEPEGEPGEGEAHFEQVGCSIERGQYQVALLEELGFRPEREHAN